jgi:thymidylate synthase ThyX
MNEQGITGEKANDLMRTMLPIGVQCNLTMGFTIEALIHFMHKRLCVRADAPIRKVAQLMKQAVLEVEPRYEELLVPQCQANMYCPEKHSCGAYPSKQEIQELIQLGKEAKNK